MLIPVPEKVDRNREILTLWARGRTLTYIALKFGLCPSRVSQIVRRMRAQPA